MKIVSIGQVTRKANETFFNLFKPSLTSVFAKKADLRLYEVTKEQDMRLDLIMLDMYDNDFSVLENMDIICFINDLDNPLNVYPGMKLFYPPQEQFDFYRYNLPEESDKATVQKSLAVPNKTTKTDPNRKKFIDNGYSLPPTIRSTPQEPITIEGGTIKIGGL